MMIDIMGYAEWEELNGLVFQNVRPDLTVVVNSYNFEDFIRDTLDGILLQKTKYRMEVLIYDDASSDGTQSIIREYCDKYPYLFHGFLARKNVYGSFNALESAEFEIHWMIRYVHGKYTALCEGDDYWNDENKIQLQLDYMEAHPECKMTMHDALLIDYRTMEERSMKTGEPEHDISPEELLSQKNGIWPTASMVFTRDVALCKSLYLRCGVGDWPRQLYAVSRGKVHYFDRMMSVYRYQHKKSWSYSMEISLCNKGKETFRMLRFLKDFNNDTQQRFTDSIIQRAGRLYLDRIERFPSFEEWNDFLNKIESALKNEGDLQGIGSFLKEQYKLIRDPSYLPETIEEFFQKHKRIYIFGTGRMSKIMTKKLQERNIAFAGYVVSDDVKIREGASDVLHLSELVREEDTGLIVAVGPLLYCEIKKSISAYMMDCIYPFINMTFLMCGKRGL